MVLASAAGRTASSAPCTTASISTRRRSRRIFPVLILDRSSRSSISFICTSALRTIAFFAFTAAASSRNSPLCSILAQPYTAFSGVRSSCDSTPMNSSFARSAASAVSRARRSFRRRLSRSISPFERSSAAVCSATPTCLISRMDVCGRRGACLRPSASAAARSSSIGRVMVRATHSAPSAPRTIDSATPPP